jgi:hypothetical protein
VDFEGGVYVKNIVRDTPPPVSARTFLKTIFSPRPAVVAGLPTIAGPELGHRRSARVVVGLQPSSVEREHLEVRVEGGSGVQHLAEADKAWPRQRRGVLPLHGPLAVHQHGDCAALPPHDHLVHSRCALVGARLAAADEVNALGHEVLARVLAQVGLAQPPRIAVALPEARPAVGPEVGAAVRGERAAVVLGVVALAEGQVQREDGAWP